MYYAFPRAWGVRVFFRRIGARSRPIMQVRASAQAFSELEKSEMSEKGDNKNETQNL